SRALRRGIRRPDRAPPRQLPAGVLPPRAHGSRRANRRPRDAPAGLTEMTRPSGEQVEISHGDQRVVVVEVGGGLRTYSIAGRAVLDGYRADEMSRSGRGQVLIPWPNRLEDGSYEFAGRRHQAPIDDPAVNDAIHGLAWWAAWPLGRRAAERV